MVTYWIGGNKVNSLDKARGLAIRLLKPEVDRQAKMKKNRGFVTLKMDIMKEVEGTTTARKIGEVSVEAFLYSVYIYHWLPFENGMKNVDKGKWLTRNGTVARK